jgi:hypothetical protein
MATHGGIGSLMKVASRHSASSIEEKKEAEKNNKAARLWISGLEAVNRKLGLSRVIDLSATSFFLARLAIFGSAGLQTNRAIVHPSKVVGKLRNRSWRKRQWRQRTKASVFAEPCMWRFSASQKQWDTAIADHADPGRVGQSMLLRFGRPTSCK